MHKLKQKHFDIASRKKDKKLLDKVVEASSTMMADPLKEFLRVTNEKD